MSLGPRLKNKVCIITGGSRGIGAVTGRLFVQEGAAVMLADIKDELGRTDKLQLNAIARDA